MRSTANFASDAIVSVAAAATGRAVALLGIVATTRVFPAEIYGTWLLVLTFSNFFLPLATLRLEIPFVMARSNRMVKGLLGIIAICVFLILALVIAFGTLANAAIIERITGLAPNRSAFIYFAGPTVLLLSAQLMVQSALMKAKNFHGLAIVNLAIPLISLVLTLVLPLMFPVTPELAAIIFFAATGLGLVAALPFLTKMVASLGDWFSWRAMTKAAFRRYNVYPKLTLPLSLSVAVTERIIQLVLAQAYSIETLASFYLARQILNGFTSVVGGSLRNVLFAHSASESNHAVTRNRALNMLKLLTYLLAPALAFACFRLEELLTLATASKWPSLAPMSWLCMFPATMVIFTGPLDRVFDLTGRQRLSVALQLVSDAIMLVTVALAVRTGATAQTLVALISTVIVAYNVIWLCFTLNAVRVPWLETANLFVRFFLLFVFCLLLQWLCTFINFWLASWTVSALVLAATLVPGLVAMAAFMFPGRRPLVKWANSLQELP